MPKSRIKIKRDIVLPRPEPTRSFSLFVIAVEGEKTERLYFLKFGNSKIKVVTLPTTAGYSSPEHIMERLSTYRQHNDLQDEDECWLVFDIDHRTDDFMETMYEQALKRRFRLAVSNPCFEIWLFLHGFDMSELDNEIRQANAEKRSAKMKEFLPYNYRAVPIHQFRLDLQQAIQRAKELEKGRNKHYPRFPGTDVYKLVEHLPMKFEHEGEAS